MPVAPTQSTRPRRLVDLGWSDPRRLLLDRPAGNIEAIFDGHVELDSTCFRLTDDGTAIALSAPPAFVVRAVVGAAS